LAKNEQKSTVHIEYISSDYTHMSVSVWYVGWSGSRSEARWRRAIFASLPRPVAYHFAVDGAAHTVVQLRIQLR